MQCTFHEHKCKWWVHVGHRASAKVLLGRNFVRRSFGLGANALRLHAVGEQKNLPSVQTH